MISEMRDGQRVLIVSSDDNTRCEFIVPKNFDWSDSNNYLRCTRVIPITGGHFDLLYDDQDRLVTVAGPLGLIQFNWVPLHAGLLYRDPHAHGPGSDPVP